MDEPVQQEPSRRPWLGTLRRWTGRALVALAIVVLTPIVASAALVSPFLADDVRLDRVVRAVALDWRDFGEEQARSRLEFELDHQGIGLQVGDDDCTLIEEEGWRRVDCTWVTEMAVPGRADPVLLPFASRAAISPEGDLE